MEVGEGRPYKTADFFFSARFGLKRFLTRCWFQIHSLLLSPLFGEMIQMD